MYKYIYVYIKYIFPAIMETGLSFDYKSLPGSSQLEQKELFDERFCFSCRRKSRLYLETCTPLTGGKHPPPLLPKGWSSLHPHLLHLTSLSFLIVPLTSLTCFNAWWLLTVLRRSQDDQHDSTHVREMFTCIYVFVIHHDQQTWT